MLAYSIIKHEMIEYARVQGLGPDTIELYAEEELEHNIGRFFDCAIYRVVRGFEYAINGHAGMAAAGGRG